MSSLESELEMLLSESVEHARKRSHETFGEMMTSVGGRVVLFGAGNMGRQVLTRLRQEGIEPLAFADNSKANWGRVLNEVQVLSPEAAVAKYGRDALFIVTICNRDHDFRETRAQLKAMGSLQVESVIPLRWRYHETFLPFYHDDLPHKVLEQSVQIREAMGVWSDEVSRREFVAQIRWRLLGDFSGLGAPSQGCQYFPPGLFRLMPKESFVDVGAYNGDTIRDYLQICGGSFGEILALEPDPENYKQLDRFIRDLPAGIAGRIDAKPVAAGNSNGNLRFQSGCGEGSLLHPNGGVDVRCVRLDDFLGSRAPTYIKMDIEGAELDALDGAKISLRQHTPLVAACAYHTQDHLWRLPLTLRKVSPTYSLFLRSHRYECWDTVCYAVPSSRLIT